LEKELIHRLVKYNNKFDLKFIFIYVYNKNKLMEDDSYFEGEENFEEEDFTQEGGDDDTVETNLEIDDPESGDDGEEAEEEQDDNSILVKNKDNRYDIVSYAKTYEQYYTGKKQTKPFITKYERAKLLGVRAEMIASGSAAMIPVPKGVTSAYDIALLEFNAKKIPLMVRRFLPNGQHEDWRLEDMISI